MAVFDRFWPMFLYMPVKQFWCHCVRRSTFGCIKTVHFLWEYPMDSFWDFWNFHGSCSRNRFVVVCISNPFWRLGNLPSLKNAFITKHRGPRSSGILNGTKGLFMFSSSRCSLQVKRNMGWNLNITFVLTLVSISASNFASLRYSHRVLIAIVE